MRRQLFLALFLGLLLFGCVEERTISVTGYETIETIGGADLTGDGVNDLLTYSYRSIPIDQPAGISMSRKVSIAPYSYSYVISAFAETPDLEGAKSLIQEFDTQRKSGESACIQRLQLSLPSCIDTQTCVQNCMAEYCTMGYSMGGDAFGDELLSFKQKSEEMDRTVAELLATSSLPTQGEKEQFIRKIVRVMALSSDLYYNNIFNPQTYNLCTPLQLPLDKLDSAAQKIATVEISPDRYRYRVAEVVTGGSEDEYISVFIQDTPPIVMTIDELSVDIDGIIYQRLPLRLGWENLRLDAYRKVPAYSFTSPDPADESIMTKWSNPQVNERNIKFLGIFNTILTNPIVAFFLNFAKEVFALFYSLGAGYFASLGAAASFLLYSALFIILALQFLFHAAHAYIDRKSVREFLVDKMGPPITDWRTYLAVGVFLVAVSLALGALYIRPTDAGELDIATIQLKIASDIMGALSGLIFIFGAYTIYLVLEDFLKGLLLGEEYYHAKGATKEENLASLSKMKVLISNLKIRIETMSRTGMEVKEEYAVILAVPMDRLEQLVDMGKQNTARSLINFHTERLDAMDKRIEQKVAIMEQNWPVWNTEIEKALDQSAEVPVETLVSIPLQWRDWAVNKFISEHRSRNLILEDNKIKRRQVSVENLINTALGDVRRSGLAQASIVLQNGKVVSNTFSKGNTAVGAVLMLKLIGYAKAISKKFGEDPKRFVIMGKKSAAAWLPGDGTSPLLFTERGRLKELMEEWKKKLGQTG